MKQRPILLRSTAGIALLLLLACDASLAMPEFARRYDLSCSEGGNGETVIEDAWFRHADLFGSGIGMMLGQFQVSDLMFPREVRLTFQDFYAYRAAGITYDRGVILDRGVGNFDVAIGAVNGSGISSNFDINEINSLTFTASYFMRNVKGVIEVDADLLGEERGVPPFVGHQTKEHYVLIGFDMAL